jgi:hypothetical protein
MFYCQKKKNKTVTNKMTELNKTTENPESNNLNLFYTDLKIFLSSLQKLVPNSQLLQYSIEELNNNDNHKTDLFDRLSVSFTKTFQTAFFEKNEILFFDNSPFVSFIGGFEVFGSLSNDEQELFWGNIESPSVLASCIQRGLDRNMKTPVAEKSVEEQPVEREQTTFVDKQKQSILASFFNDLYILLTNLVTCFPDNVQLCKSLKHLNDDKTLKLFQTFSSSFTKDILVHFLNRDKELFFLSSSKTNNTFVQFIGGKTVFDQLDEEGVELYWGTDKTPSLVSSCLRHGLNLQTLLNNKKLLDSCMNMFPKKSLSKDPKPINMSNIFSTLQDTIKTDGMIDTISELVSDENGIQNAVNMLQSLLISTTMDSSAAKEYSKTTSDKCEGDLQQTTPKKEEQLPSSMSSLLSQMNNFNLSENEEDFKDEFESTLPSTLFKKENKIRDQTTSKKEEQFPSSMSALLAQMNNFDLGDMQEELKEAIGSGELKNIVNSVCDTIDPTTMLQDLQNGSLDLKSMFQ